MKKIHAVGGGSLGRILQFNARVINQTDASLAEWFSAQPSDVFLVALENVGATIVSHISHLLRSNATGTFENLLDVVPWATGAPELRPRLLQGQNFTPRLF